MHLELFDIPDASVNDSFAIGTPADLVFDDEPLEPLLCGDGQSIAPTPANVVEMWQQGHDRSPACARALAAVLLKRSDDTNQIADLDAASDCLLAALKSPPAAPDADRGACLAALARILELKKQPAEAETLYRQALELQVKTIGDDHEATWVTAGRLIDLLERTGRKLEAVQPRNRLKAQRLTGREDDSSLWDLRATALDMFLAGQYAEAEEVYRRLVEKRYERCSTHCHLARVYLMTDREAEARLEVDRAFAVRHQSPAYACVRMRFLQTLVQMLAGADWLPNLVGLQEALSEPNAHMDWKMQPVLDHLKPRLGSERYDLMSAVLNAICESSKLAELKANPLWKTVCGDPETSASAASGPLPPPPAVEATSAEAVPADALPDNDRFTFGTVVSIKDDRLTLKEYDFTTDTDVENEYVVTEQTEFGNLAKLGDLAGGDSVVVDYLDANGQRTISVLVKEVPMPEAASGEGPPSADVSPL